jgi:hypothetical protein
MDLFPIHSPIVPFYFRPKGHVGPIEIIHIYRRLSGIFSVFDLPVPFPGIQRPKTERPLQKT